MWKIFMLLAQLLLGVRSNEYYKSYGSSYYPRKLDYQAYHGESSDYGYGYPAYPSLYLPVGHYGYPELQYHGYADRDDDIYDYKLKMKPEEKPMEKVEKLETHHQPPKGNKDVLKMQKIVAEMKKKEEERKAEELNRQKKQQKMMEEKRMKMTGKETVHKPKYDAMEMPKVVTKTEDTTMDMKPEVRTRVPATKKEMKPMDDPVNTGLMFIGKYEGSCGDDGLYYKDETSYVICTATRAIVQPCAPGTQNVELKSFTPGSEYNKFDFCTINLVARGTYSSPVMAGAGEGREQKGHMNERVKNYFQKHYRVYV